MFDKKVKVMLKVPAHLSYLIDLRNLVEKVGHENGFSKRVVNAIKLAMEEAVANIIKHAYRGKSGSVVMKVMVDEDSLTVSLLDQGRFFDPNCVNDPDITQHAMAGRKGGLGIMLMRRLVDRMECQKTKVGNELRLTKFRTGAAKPGTSQGFLLASLCCALLCFVTLSPSHLLAELVHRGRVETETIVAGQQSACNDFYNKGVELYNANFFAKALAQFKQAFPCYQMASQKEQALQSLLMIGEMSRLLEMNEQAIAYFEKARKYLVAQAIDNPASQAQLHYLLGLAYESSSSHSLAAGQFDQAIRIYRTMVNPEGLAKSHYGLGMSYLNDERYLPAAQAFHDAAARYGELNNRERQALCLYYVGRSYYQNDSCEQAMGFYSQALQAGPDAHTAARAYFDLAGCYNRAGQAQEALSAYEKAKNQFIQSGNAQSAGHCSYNIGNHYINAEEWARAHAAFEQASRLYRQANDYENVASTLLMLGHADFNRGSMTEARSHYEETIGLAAQKGLPALHAKALWHAGTAHYAEGAYKTAVSALRDAAGGLEAQSLFSEAVQAHQKIGDALLKLGQLEAASQAYFRAITRSIAYPDLRSELAESRLKFADVLNAMANYTQGLREYESAISLFRELNSGADKIAECLFGMGQCNSKQDQYSEAALHFGEAAQSYRAAGQLTNAAHAIFNAGNAYQNVENYPVARARFEQALDLYGQMDKVAGQASCHLRLAQLKRLEFNDMAAALHSATKARDLYMAVRDSGGLAECFEELGNIHRQTEPPDLASAETAYRQARELYSDLNDADGQADCDLGLAQINFERELYLEAFDLFQQAATVYTNNQDYDNAGLCFENSGHAMFNLHRWQEGVNGYRQAIFHYQKNNRSDKIARCNLHLGDCYLPLRNYDDSWRSYQSSLTYYDQITDYAGICKNLLGLGDVHFKQGKYREASAKYEEALVRTSAYISAGLLVEAYNKVAESAAAVGDFEKALKHYNLNYDIVRQEGWTRKQLTILTRIADLYDQSDRYEEAMTQFRQVYGLADHDSLSEFRRLAVINIAGIHYQIGVEDSALYYFETAYRLAKAARDSGHVAESLTGLGNIQRRREQYDDALNSFEQVLAIAHARRDSGSTSTALLNIGNVYYDLQQQERAIDHYRQSRDLSALLKSSQGMATAYNNLGIVDLRRGMNPVALENFYHAEQEAEKTYLKRLLITIYSNQGVTYENMGNYGQARQAYGKAIKLVEEIRGRFQKQEMLFTSYVENTADLYDRLISLLFEKLDDDLAAFEYIERSRSLDLTELYKQRQRTTGNTQRLAELDALENSIKSHLRAWRELHAQVTLHPESNVPAELSKREAETAHEVMKLERELLENYPDYPGMVEIRAATISSIQNQIPADAAVVTYYPSRSRLYVYIATPNQYVARSVAISRDSLYAKVNLYRKTIMAQRQAAVDNFTARRDPKKDVKDYLKVSSWRESKVQPMVAITTELYDILLAPFEKDFGQVKTLIIIPSGQLFYLPFHALAERTHPDGLRFAIENWTIAYLTSATFARSLGSKRGRSHDDCLARVGALGYSTGRPELPGVRREMNSLRQFAPRATIFEDAQATVARARQLRRESCIFIVSSHYNVNQSRTDESQIALADGPWRIMDIEGGGYPDMNLAIFPNCQTAIGEEEPKFGVHNLAQAFTATGAASVIATLWQVSDLFTPDLMHNFYRNFFQRRFDKAQALQQAQISLLRNPQTRHPFFWAGFLLYGYWFDDAVPRTTIKTN